MAVTRTKTSTKTFTRLALLKLQVGRVLSRCWIDDHSVRRVLDGVQSRCISEIMLYGIDGKGARWAELSMRIDWHRNELHVKAGRNSVEIDARWKGDVAIEVENTLSLFEDYVRESNLTIVVNTSYIEGVDEAAANASFGFMNVPAPQWAGNECGTEMTISELDEFSIGIKLVE